MSELVSQLGASRARQCTCSDMEMLDGTEVVRVVDAAETGPEVGVEAGVGADAETGTDADAGLEVEAVAS